MKLKGAAELKNDSIKLMGVEIKLRFMSGNECEAIREKIKPKGSVKWEDGVKTEELSDQQLDEFSENSPIAIFLNSVENKEVIEFNNGYDINNLDHKSLTEIRKEMGEYFGFTEMQYIRNVGHALMSRDISIFKEAKKLFLLERD